MADYLVRANLAGVDSHGIIRVPDYVQMVEEGKMRPNVVPRIVRERGAMATVDAGLGYGQVATKMAMELAMKQGKGVRNRVGGGLQLQPRGQDRRVPDPGR